MQQRRPHRTPTPQRSIPAAPGAAARPQGRPVAQRQTPGRPSATLRATPSPASAAAATSLDQLVTQLDDNLGQQMAQHEQLLNTMQLKRQALREAKHQVVTDCCMEENRFVQQISELEKARLQLVASMTSGIDPQAAQPLPMVDLAQRLPEPARGRLLVRRQQLRERMQQVQRETEIARKATDALMTHMQGLVQTVGSFMTGVTTYARSAQRRAPGVGQAVSTFTTTA